MQISARVGLSWIAAVVLAPPWAMAEPTPSRLLHEVFADHAVLQRDRPIPVWGDAAGGDRITVSMGAAMVDTRADAHGHWRVALPPGLPAVP